MQLPCKLRRTFEKLMIRYCLLRVRARIDSQNWRPDLGQIWLRRLSKTTGTPTPRGFEGFTIEVRPLAVAPITLIMLDFAVNVQNLEIYPGNPSKRVIY